MGVTKDRRGEASMTPKGLEVRRIDSRSARLHICLVSLPDRGYPCYRDTLHLPQKQSPQNWLES